MTHQQLYLTALGRAHDAFNKLATRDMNRVDLTFVRSVDRDLSAAACAVQQLICIIEKLPINNENTER